MGVLLRAEVQLCCDLKIEIVVNIAGRDNFVRITANLSNHRGDIGGNVTNNAVLFLESVI